MTVKHKFILFETFNGIDVGTVIHLRTRIGLHRDLILFVTMVNPQSICLQRDIVTASHVIATFNIAIVTVHLVGIHNKDTARCNLNRILAVCRTFTGESNENNRVVRSQSAANNIVVRFFCIQI